jgi:hypothetical protein
MRTSRLNTSASMCLLGVIVLFGCDTPPPARDAAIDDASATDAAIPSDDANADAGPAAVTHVTYTPTGCGYEVRSPNVISAAMSSDVFGATPTADHVHVSWSGPTETTMTVIWRSDVDTLASSVLVGTDEAAVMAADGATTGVTRQDGHTVLYSSATSGAGAERLHEVHLCGLTPDTTYYYRVGGPGHWSTAFQIATAPAAGSTAAWSFGVTGDSRGDGLTNGPGDNAWAILQHHLADRGVDFEMFTGDGVFLGTSQPLWNLWFDGTDGTHAVQDFLATRPLMMSNGNHDLLTINYLAQFAMPQDASTGELADGEEWYSFDYANAHFVVLNDTTTSAGTIAGAEATWLEADLSAVNRTTTPWIFVVHHMAMYTCGSGGAHAPDTTSRSAWQPIYDAHHVDFVLNGHNHFYQRSYPINGIGTVAAHDASGAPTITGGQPSGTVYVVAGGAGAPFYTVGTCPEIQVGMAVRNYMTFEIANRTLTMTTHDGLTDAVIDTMTYTK